MLSDEFQGGFKGVSKFFRKFQMVFGFLDRFSGELYGRFWGISKVYQKVLEAF